MEGPVLTPEQATFQPKTVAQPDLFVILLYHLKVSPLFLDALFARFAYPSCAILYPLLTRKTRTGPR
jgi:hypothetical protein